LFLLVVRSVAVYFAICALALFFVHRYIRRISWAVAAFAVLVPWLITGRAMLTGGVYAPVDIAYQAHPLAALAGEVGIEKTKSPILGDVVFQEIPWRKAVRDAVKNGRLPLWNRFILAGEPLLAMQQPVVLHPATWFGMLLPLGAAWTFEMTFTLFFALLFAWLFCRELGLSDVAAAVGAASWAFSDYVLFFLGYPLSPSVAPFPLLLLGLTRIARERTAAGAGITASALLLAILSGHSETLLHMVAAAGVYFLFLLFSESRGRRARAVLLAFAAGGIALALGAVILLPHLEALPHTFEYFFRHSWYANADRSDDLSTAVGRLAQAAIPYAAGSSGHGDTTPGEGPSIAYVGSVLFPLAAVGLFSRRRIKWAFILIGLLGLALWSRFPVVTDVVCKLPLFDIALNERLIFVTAFALAVLAAFGVERVVDEGATKGAALAAVVVLVLIVVGNVLLQERLHALHTPPEYLRLQFLLSLVPLGLLAIWLIARNGRSGSRTAAVVLGLVLAQRTAEAALLYPVIPSRAFYPPLPLLDPIPRDQPYRTTSVGFTFVPNVSALYELEDVRGYEAMTFRRLVDTFPLWCVPQPVWFNRVDDPTKPFLSFLNVRYFLLPDGAEAPAGWPMLASGLGMRLLENPHVLPRAFVPAHFQVEPDGGRRLQILQGISDFGRYGVVEGLEGRPRDVWFANGRASVETLSYTPQTFSVAVDAQAPALIATSLTAWPGWRLTIDGRRAGLLGYNHAFLAFAVPAGRHRADLEYMPSGFLAGAAVTGSAIVALAAAGAIRRRRRSRQRSFRSAIERDPTLPAAS
jgi:Bacterial membrane protein YfhO